MTDAWQPLGEPMQWGQATVDMPSHSHHQGKAYMGKAFLDDEKEQAERDRAAIQRPERGAELKKKNGLYKNDLGTIKTI